MVKSPSCSPPQAPTNHDAAALAIALATTSSPSADESSQLPKGQCRYILTIPGLQGQRCGCTSFEHNTTIPGASCRCGHLSCYHLFSAESFSPPLGQTKADMDAVKQRLGVLEQAVEQGGSDRVSGVVGRISQLEETVECYKDEAQGDIKAAFRNSYSAWQMVEKLETRLKSFEAMFQAQADSLARTNKELEYLRNRQLELIDVNEVLEERIQSLESTDLSDVAPPPPHEDAEPTPTPTGNTSHQLAPSDRAALDDAKKWTIHVSLMPSKARPFPFEKDTTAYQRCLSRGLHRMVAIEGDDAPSFTTAVSKSFAPLLQGRAWMPLQAKICDAAQLQGLPMLRPLEPKLTHGQYDRAFLRKHCAVFDAGGNMESLYIAMENDTLPWEFLKRAPIHTENLESSWEYDALLDQQDELDRNMRQQTMEEDDEADYDYNEDGDKRQPVSNIVTQFTLLKKRSASEVARSSGFDDTEGSRKIPRTCKSRLIEVQRGVETAL